MAHTPGPWKVKLASDGYPVEIVRADGQQSAPCECPSCREDAPSKGRTYSAIVETDSHVYGPSLADAHLIAAAPEMYEALKTAVAHLSEFREAWARGVIRESDNLGGTRSNRNVDVESVVFAAIRKAEGRE